MKTSLQFAETGKKIVMEEINELLKLEHEMNARFDSVCEKILSCTGKVIITGVGKSGHIGRKIAATFSSTGTPAFFLHPSEAGHGDCGTIAKNDILIAISYSGESEELKVILPLVKNLNVCLIAICGQPNSTLAKYADFFLSIAINAEACTLGLAPTSSTTKTLVLGDALAVSLLEARGFNKDDFARSHPSGKLGKRLTTRVIDIMHHSDELPRASENELISSAIIEMTNKGFGTVAVYRGNSENIIGIFTDGDLRRTFEKNIDIQTTSIKQVMITNFKTISENVLAIDALELLKKFKITSLFVVDSSNSINGILHIHDIIGSGIV
ncbi:MAG: KpsF/GutQ family sugar-phosphate isomerase [Pseudomonadota bacterium]|nr:KpsF/GutQ family sugar-phosphate isomerase [Pseudomonadota bacterium]